MTLAGFGSGLVSNAGISTAFNGLSSSEVKAGEQFNCLFAPHFGLFKHHAGEGVLDQLRFMYDEGFRAFEDNGMPNRSEKMQAQIGDFLRKHDMTMGVFVAHDIQWSAPNFSSGDPSAKEAFLKDIKKSVEIAKRCGATWMTVVPGTIDPKLAGGYQFANTVDLLRQACDVLEPHGLIMVLEPLNPHVDHPNMYLSRSDQAYAICKAVNSPSCKILFDIYHQQITEGNLTENIDLSWKEIAYFQIGDHPGRNYPGTGEINYQHLFRHIYEKGFRGVLGMEHSFGDALKNKEDEKLLLKAYRSVDV